MHAGGMTRSSSCKLCMPIAAATHVAALLLISAAGARYSARSLSNAAPVVADCPTSTSSGNQIDDCEDGGCILVHPCPQEGVVKWCIVPLDFDVVAGDVPNDDYCNLLDEDTLEVIDGAPAISNLYSLQS